MMRRKAQVLPERVRRDVATVRKEALAVITIKPNRRIEIKRNLRGRLGIIAVVGPARDEEGNHYQEALLTEIGLWKSSPYHATHGTRKVSWGHGRRRRKRRQWIPGRRDYFHLTEESYRLVSRAIFCVIQEFVDRRIATWMCGTHWRMVLRISSENSRKRNSEPTFLRFRSFARGIQVRFPARDRIFLPDLYWLELHNLYVKVWIEDFAGWLRNRIQCYEQGYSRKDFRTLVGFRSAARLIRNNKLPRRLKLEAINRLPGERHYPRRPELLELLGYPEDDESPYWRTYAAQALRPQVRLKGICACIKRERGEFVVCEFFAQNEHRFKRKVPWNKFSSGDSDIPF